MTFSKFFRFACAGLLLAGLGLGSSASVFAADGDSARVRVDWTDPAQFSEVRYSHNAFNQPKPESWLNALKKTVITRADKLLPDGQQLEVTFTDVQLAGKYEPWRGAQYNDVRIVKSIYPPHIDLRFTLRDANGSVIESGERKLRDPGFLDRSSVNGSDSYRFEKRMLKEWLTREFGAERSVAQD